MVYGDVKSMVLLGVEIVANAKLFKPLSSSETRKDSSRKKLQSKVIKKAATKAKSSTGVDLMSLKPEILTTIFTFLKIWPYSNCSGQHHIIPRTLLSSLTGVCKRIDSLIQENFPDETLHLILARNSPSQVHKLFKSNPRIKNAFDKCIRESLGSSHTSASKPDPDETRDDDSDEEELEGCWCGFELSQGYMHRALDMCQKGVVEAFVRSGAVPREDVELHIAVIFGQHPLDLDRMFLALKSRTIAFEFDATQGVEATTAAAIDAPSTRDIDPRPAPPHALWLAARVLSLLGSAGVAMRYLEPVTDDLEPVTDDRDWRLTAQARDPGPGAGLGLKFVTGVSPG